MFDPRLRAILDLSVPSARLLPCQGLKARLRQARLQPLTGKLAPDQSIADTLDRLDDGECLVGTTPPSQPWQVATMTSAAVARDCLLRVTRLAFAIGLHTGEMTLDEAAMRMIADAYVHPAMARQRAARGLFDPRMGEYTWGKLIIILDLREQAQKAWGTEFGLARFHGSLLDLGSAPLGLLPTAIERG